MELKRTALILLLASPLLAQEKYDPKKVAGRLQAALQGGPSCASGFEQMPETTLETVRRYFFNTERRVTIHVTFAKPCATLDRWILHIRDVTDAAGDVKIRTLNETPLGMDIEALRGHAIEWRISTR
jgi:hypothetical protein